MSTRKSNIKYISKDEIYAPAKMGDEIYTGYLISNYGRLYSEKSDKMLTPKIKKGRRIQYKLYSNGKEKDLSANRLVAYAFVKNPKPDEFNVVHHVDGNPLNNKWDNLIWCTQKHNLNVGTVQKKRAKTMSRAVVQRNVDGIIVAKYSGMTTAARKTGIPLNTIFKACKDGKIYNGFYWNYKGKDSIKRTTGRKQVNQYDGDGNIIASYNSIREVARQFDVGVGSAYNWCKKDNLYMGSYWKYA